MRAILVDMDGTLCDVQGIRHYVECDRPDFRSFHEASRFCPTRPEVEAEVRRAAAEGLAVVIVTARDERFERATRDFLLRHRIPYHALHMRPWGDRRRDAVVKAEILERIVREGFEPVRAIEDRLDIAQVWSAHGIEVSFVGDERSPGRSAPRGQPTPAAASRRTGADDA